MDALIDGMECGSPEALQHLDLLQQPLLAELRSAPAGRPASQAPLCLLATLCEKMTEAAAELRREGAVASVAQHLLQGVVMQGSPAHPLGSLPAFWLAGWGTLGAFSRDQHSQGVLRTTDSWSVRCVAHVLPAVHLYAGDQQLQDVAARAMWRLVQDERQCLGPTESQLGCGPMPVALVLVQLIEAAAAEEVGAPLYYEWGCFLNQAAIFRVHVCRFCFVCLKEVQRLALLAGQSPG